jgi:uncharacterized delta-60 repeat protein
VAPAGSARPERRAPLGYTITQVNPNGPDQINALIIQPDDKIVAAGETDYSSNDQLTLARYNSDGSLDTTFGANQSGTLLLPATQLSSELQWTSVAAVTLQPQSDGTNKIVVVGSAVMSDPTSTTSTRSVLVVRFNADGTLDGTFDGGQGYTLAGNGSAAGVAVDASGRIIVGGSGSDGISVARLSPDGTVDTTFGTSGVKTATLSGGLSGGVDGLTLTSDGNIYVRGTAADSSYNYYPLLVHFEDTP